MEILQAIIIDDEPFVRDDLRFQLSHHDDIAVAGEAGDIAEARRLLGQTSPDVVFLDIQLLGGSGFDLVPDIDPGCAIVFVTAHDNHAIRAFEVNALDYVLKPVAPPRLAATLARLRQHAGARRVFDRPVFSAGDRILLRGETEQCFVPVRDILAVSSVGGNYTAVHVSGGGRTLLRRTLREWERILPAGLFLRIHRAHLVNVAAIERVERASGGTCRVWMPGLAEPLTSSRRMAPRLREIASIIKE